jgi:hypothetical protein
MSWSSAGLYLATGDQLCCAGPEFGQTVGILRYDASTLVDPTTIYHAKDEYFLEQVVSTPSTLYVLARAYALGPGPSGTPSDKVHLIATQRLFTLGADGRLSLVGPAALARGFISAAR